MVNGKHNKLKHARIRIEVRDRVSSQDIIRDISMRVWVWVLAAPVTVTVTASESQRNPKQRNRNSGQRDIRFLFLVWLASWLPSWLPGCLAGHSRGRWANLYSFEAFSQHWTKEMLTMSACLSRFVFRYFSFFFVFFLLLFFPHLLVSFCCFFSVFHSLLFASRATLLCGPLARQTLNDVVPTAAHTRTHHIRTLSITNFN